MVTVNTRTLVEILLTYEEAEALAELLDECDTDGTKLSEMHSLLSGEI